MKYIKSQDLLNKDVLTYQEILNLKKRFGGMTKNKDITYSEAEFKEEYAITPEHTQKGLEYLNRVTFKPSLFANFKPEWKERNIQDAMRSSSPLGTREAYILVNFDHFTFAGFYDATNMYQADAGYKVLYPLWRLYDNEGDSFEYYLEGGVMQIIG